MPELPDPPPASSLLRPLSRVLRPLLRLLIRGGLTYPVFADLVRGLYVEQAAAMLARGAARTDSRLSLLTGVHRKEIRRLRELAGEAPEVPPVVTLTSQIMARWLGLPAYSDAQGQPLPLPRNASGEAPSFERLVAMVTTDLRPRTVLDDWLSQGLVSMDAADRVILDASAFLPRAGTEEQLYYFTRNLHDHMAAATTNLANTPPPFLDRAVHYDRLPPAIAMRMEEIGRAAAQRMLVEVNREVLALLEAEGEAPPGTPTRRVNLGVFLYAEAEAPGHGEEGQAPGGGAAGGPVPVPVAGPGGGTPSTAPASGLAPGKGHGEAPDGASLEVPGLGAAETQARSPGRDAAARGSGPMVHDAPSPRLAPGPSGG